MLRCVTIPKMGSLCHLLTSAFGTGHFGSVVAVVSVRDCVWFCWSLLYFCTRIQFSLRLYEHNSLCSVILSNVYARFETEGWFSGVVIVLNWRWHVTFLWLERRLEWSLTGTTRPRYSNEDLTGSFCCDFELNCGLPKKRNPWNPRNPANVTKSTV